MKKTHGTIAVFFAIATAMTSFVGCPTNRTVIPANRAPNDLVGYEIYFIVSEKKHEGREDGFVIESTYKLPDLAAGSSINYEFHSKGVVTGTNVDISDDAKWRYNRGSTRATLDEGKLVIEMEHETRTYEFEMNAADAAKVSARYETKGIGKHYVEYAGEFRFRQ